MTVSDQSTPAAAADTFTTALHEARAIERRAHDEIRAVLKAGGVDPNTFDLAPALPTPHMRIDAATEFVRECLTPLARLMAYVEQADTQGLHPHLLGTFLVDSDYLDDEGNIGVFPPGTDFESAYNAVSWAGDVLSQAWHQY